MTENGLETNVDDITNQSNSIPNSGVSIKEERLGSIMDAASALNSLGDENETHVADVVDPEPESAQITEKDAKILSKCINHPKNIFLFNGRIR